MTIKKLNIYIILFLYFIVFLQVAQLFRNYVLKIKSCSLIKQEFNISTPNLEF